METIEMIDWASSSNEIFFNPRIPISERDRLLAGLYDLKNFQGHILIATSGSSGLLKWTLLSKEAFLISAKAVNSHLQSHASDIWFNVLPTFHVGGLGIIARSSLSRAKVVPYTSSRWNSKEFIDQLVKAQATLTSLVPAQLFDLVSHSLQAPSCLRAIIIGGGSLNEKLYHEAIALGWKLLPSYGLTECASQVATATLGSWKRGEFPLLAPLEHVDLMVDSKGYLKIKSPALLTAYFTLSNSSWECMDPKIEGWLTTEDKPILYNGGIAKINRGGDFVKIGGESVDLTRLERILEEEKITLKIAWDVVLIALPHERLENSIHLIVSSDQSEMINKLAERFNQKVFPYERIRSIKYLSEIPRSPLHKILKNELISKLQTSKP